MRPPLRYAKTVDGGSVAYTVMGEGHTVLEFFPHIAYNVALDWNMPAAGEWYHALARYFRLVRFEVRGLANSDPAPEERTMLDYVCDDIEAVRSALGVERFALMTGGPHSLIALRYATEHPEQVRSLALHNPTTEEIGWGDPAVRAAYEKAVELQASLAGIDVIAYNAQLQAGAFADRATVDALERIMRTNASPKAQACWEKIWELHATMDDYQRYLPRVTQRVLITTDSPFFEAMAKGLAAAIPGALLVLGTGAAAERSLNAGDRSSAAARQAQFFYGKSEPGPRGHSSVAGLSGLTDREREILALIAAGHSNSEIAESLVLSDGTVRRHVANIYDKLGIHNRAQATAMFYGHAAEGRED